jgi:hypothetical protein
MAAMLFKGSNKPYSGPGQCLVGKLTVASLRACGPASKASQLVVVVVVFVVKKTPSYAAHAQ